MFQNIDKLLDHLAEQTKELEVSSFMLQVEIEELTKQVDTFLNQTRE